MGHRRGWLAGLSLTGLALCVAIWMELAGYRDGARGDLPPPEPAHSQTEAAVGVEAAGQRDQWLREVVSRPLFSPDRRPAAPQERGVAGLPRLTAIIVDGRRRIAMFEAPTGGHATIAEIGSRVGAYEVRDIADGGMTLVGPEGAIVVRPKFDGAPRVAQTDAVVPVAQSSAVAPVAHRAALPAHPAFFAVTAR